MKIKKILIMGNNDHKGGLIVHYEYLVNFLYRNGYEIICLNINDNNKKNFDQKNVAEFRIPYNPSTNLEKLNKLFSIFKSCIKVLKFKPDLFIATGMGKSYTTIASILGKETFKIHQEVIFDAKLDEYHKKIIQNFDAIAVQTKSMIENYKNNVSDKINIDYLPCFTRAMEAATNSYSKTDGLIRLAYFGRLAENKGLVNFIENTRNIFRDENIILNIYGGGSEYQKIIDVINKYGISNKIFLKGFYSDEDFPNLINTYDAIILPSTHNEGLPLVLLESMFYNKPIFASKMGAIPELANINKGIYLSEFDTNQTSSFYEFLTLLKNNSFSKINIRNLYFNNFSNKCFEETWNLMLENPKLYFGKNGKK